MSIFISASEMTYIVSGGALNSTHSLILVSKEQVSQEILGTPLYFGPPHVAYSCVSLLPPGWQLQHSAYLPNRCWKYRICCCYRV